MSSSFHRLAAYLLLALYGVVGMTGDSLHYLLQEGLLQEGLLQEGLLQEGLLQEGLLQEQLVRQETASQPSSDKVAVYFHSHGTGSHGHFHRYVRRQTAGQVAHKEIRADHKEERQQARSSQAGSVRNRGGKTADENLVLDGLPHSPHSCLLLAIVKELELGHAYAGATCIDINARFESPLRPAPAAATRIDSQSLARGPPTALV